MKLLRLSILTGLYVAYLGGIAILCIFALFARDLPSTNTFWTPNRPVSVQFLDRYGRDILVRGAYEDHYVKANALPDHVKSAILSIEDRRFYTHIGIDPYSLGRAILRNFQQGGITEGGSTLSQQLAKNVFLSSEQTYRRKIREAILAVWLERTFSKDEILEKYLNRVYFGNGTWGLEAASQSYFGKSVTDLELGEGALLAGLLKAPSQLNPVSSPDPAGRRTAIVLKAMERDGHINRKNRHTALKSPIHVSSGKSKAAGNYFVDWIWSDLETLIGPPREDIVVYTTLDLEAQRAAEMAISAHINPERGAEQAAAILLDGQGAVRLMVGGTDYRDSEFNRAVQATRQPGSAFKAFVYLAAFNAGLDPWRILEDSPVKIGDWEPGNFSDTFRGKMTLETAFALSINTVAVKLSEQINPNRVVETADQMGLEGLKPYHSLALGAQDVSLIDLTAAYLPFSNWGKYSEPYGIISVSTSNGSPLYDHVYTEGERRVSSNSLGHINRIMRHVVTAGTGKAANIEGHSVAGKTGTTNDYRDAWFVGYVPGLTYGVWVGNDDNLPMKRVTGGSIPARIWKDTMTPLLRDIEGHDLPISTSRRVKSDVVLDILLDDLETALP